MEYTNKKQIENLLRLKTFHGLKVQVSLHASLNTCKGVVRCPDLKGVSEEEILEEMREQGVIHVRRIKVRRDDALKDTNTFVFIAGRPKAALLLCLLLVFFHCSFHCCCVCLACDSSSVATCPSIQRPALLFACVLLFCFCCS